MELGSDDDVDGVLKDDGIDAIEEQEDEAAIRAALHFHVGEICSGETSGKPMTGAAVSTLAEMVFKYTEALALDLRVFAKHGKRAIVGVDDVKCVARKDPKMVQALAQFETAHLGGTKKKAGRKKKGEDAGKGAAAASAGTAGGAKSTSVPQNRPAGEGGHRGKDESLSVLGDDRIKAGTRMGGGHEVQSNGEGDEFDEFLL